MNPRYWMIGPTGSMRLAVLVLAAVVTADSVRADVGGWWDRRWPWRRLVLVSPPQTGLEGPEAAWVEIFTHGACRPGGPSIRVMTTAGKPVNHFVMQAGPDDRARVCFALSGRANKYYIYYGNAKAKAPADTWRPRRGVLLEGWTYRGGSIASFKLTEQTFRKAGEVVGRTYVPNVYLGHNPFGMPSHYCHKYTGWLRCGASGQYAFSTTSKDASFLLIDEKMAVQWAGRHGPVHDARHIGRVRLDRGLHKLTYYHVSMGPNGRAVAAWQPPGAPKPVVIPASAFAPITRGAASDLSRYGTRMQADLTVDGPYETFAKDRYAYRYVFQGRVAGTRPSGMRFQWDFGDGVTGEGEQVEHVYLTAAMRTVTLTVSRGGRRSTLRNRLSVTRAWDRVTQPKLDPVKNHAKIVAGYPFDKMSPADVSAAVWLLRHGGQVRACLSAVDALPTRINQVKPNAVIKALPEIYDLLVGGPGRSKRAGQTLGQSKRAATLFETVESRADDVGVKANASAMAGRVWLEELGDLARAEACYERVVSQYADRTRTPAIRRARIGLGEVYLRTGRYRQARQAFEQAGDVGDPQKRNIRVGSYARAVDDYIRRKEFQTAAEQLNAWEWEYPLEKLRGYSTLLRARLYDRQGRHAQLTRLVEGFPMVVLEAEKPTDPVDVIYVTIDPAKLPALYKIDPRTGRIQSASGTAFPPNPYGMDMGLLAVEGHVNLKQKDKARRVLTVLIRLYPDSPLVTEAKRRLSALGG